MRIDVTLLGISGNSLRWLRRLAPWSIVPLVLGALVLGTVALGSAARYGGPQAGHYHYGWGVPDDAVRVVEQPMLPAGQKVPVGKYVRILPEQGWTSVVAHGTSLQQVGTPYTYLATHVGQTVLTASRGADHWKYTITVVAAGTH